MRDGISEATPPRFTVDTEKYSSVAGSR